MNTYSFNAVATCPVDGARIEYAVTIETHAPILVEELPRVFPSPRFHEDIADELWERFGGRQLITAIHGGVLVKTTRGE